MLSFGTHLTLLALKEGFPFIPVLNILCKMWAKVSFTGINYSCSLLLSS